MTAALLALLFTSSAFATPILTVDNIGHGLVLPLLLDDAPQDEYAYQILVTIDGTHAIAMCVDLFTNITYASYNTDALPVYTMTWGPRVAWLYDNFGRFAVTDEEAAAVQLAIWDIVHDNADGFDAGRVKLQATAPSAVRTAAEGFIASSLGQSSTHAFLYQNVTMDTLSPAQTLIAVTNPEPPTLGLAGAVLIALGMIGRKRP